MLITNNEAIYLELRNSERPQRNLGKDRGPSTYLHSDGRIETKGHRETYYRGPSIYLDNILKKHIDKTI